MEPSSNISIYGIVLEIIGFLILLPNIPKRIEDLNEHPKYSDSKKYWWFRNNFIKYGVGIGILLVISGLVFQIVSIII